MSGMDERYLEELLNGYIDGELSERQHTEVQRLIGHDEGIAHRLRELERCRLVVGSLPRSKAPAGMLERIKARVERDPLPIERVGEVGARAPMGQAGARELFVRKVLAIAAMLGLVGVLALVVYTIIVPEGEREVEIWAGAEGSGTVARTEGQREGIAAVEATVARAVFDGRLELGVEDVGGLDAFVAKIVDENGLGGHTEVTRQGSRSVYDLVCSETELNGLLADLETAWFKVGQSSLLVTGGQMGQRMTVDGVTVGQISEIVSEDSYAGRMQVARDFAVLNSMEESLAGRGVLAAMGSGEGTALTIPKPTLTSRAEGVKSAPGESGEERDVRLVIVIRGIEAGQ